MQVKVSPLNSTFMLISILGFLISIIWVRSISLSWGIAFALVFFLMFVSSMISTTYGDAEIELKMDAPKPRKKAKKKK